MPQCAGRVVDSGNAGPGWKSLYRIGGTAALIAVIFFRRNFGAELVGFRGFGIIEVPVTLPSSASDWFLLLQDNGLLGLALLNVVDLINYALVGLIFLALYDALRRTSRSAMAIATTSGLVGVAVYFASNQAFCMLSLSGQYTAATTEAQRSMFLAAGEALLAINNPGSIYQGTGIYTSLFLVLLAGLIISIVMLRSSIFSKVTAYMGILANGFGLSYFIALIFAPTIFALPTIISAPFRVVWYVLIARKLFQLGTGTSKEKTQRKGQKTGNVMLYERNTKETTMSDSVLVACTTRHGSTQEVAETVAATLCEWGLEVDIQPNSGSGVWLGAATAIA